MISQRLNTGIEVSDRDFDSFYARPMRAVSTFHFTPVEVAKTAAQFLVKKRGAKVLDVGSGAGKFCMVGAASTDGFFTGVEQRESLHLLSELLSKHHQFPNTTFIHANIMDIDFTAFDAIYFYNAFYENTFQADPIDNMVKLDKTLYTIYAQYMKEQLDKMPVGTRLATYFSYLHEIPDSYQIQSMEFDKKLKCWEKIR